ncbi:hypothetical protein FQA39_LY09215 [Lamprigera yunnana]|nr:hypothetical protein FQA39_LY09215 [Lamprigera yunnana]
MVGKIITINKVDGSNEGKTLRARKLTCGGEERPPGSLPRQFKRAAGYPRKYVVITGHAEKQKSTVVYNGAELISTVLEHLSDDNFSVEEIRSNSSSFHGVNVYLQIVDERRRVDRDYWRGREEVL